jgi:hypothetical protein
MAETDDMEFDLLRRRAEALGYFVQRHRNYDPCMPGGDLYLAPSRRFRGEHVDTILKYATADKIHAYLNGVGHGGHQTNRRA